MSNDKDLPIEDALKVDIDQDKMAAWDKIREDYGTLDEPKVRPEATPRRADHDAADHSDTGADADTGD